jgi:hypothetical protein
MLSPAREVCNVKPAAEGWSPAFRRSSAERLCKAIGPRNALPRGAMGLLGPPKGPCRCIVAIVPRNAVQCRPARVAATMEGCNPVHDADSMPAQARVGGVHERPQSFIVGQDAAANGPGKARQRPAIRPGGVPAVASGKQGLDHQSRASGVALPDGRRGLLHMDQGGVTEWFGNDLSQSPDTKRVAEGYSFPPS